jgi:hypothetical protein
MIPSSGNWHPISGSINPTFRGWMLKSSMALEMAGVGHLRNASRSSFVKSAAIFNSFLSFVNLFAGILLEKAY